MPTTRPTTALSSSRSRLRRTHTPHQWLVPAGLIVLSLIPVLAGAFRLTELTGGAEITAKNARFFGSAMLASIVLAVLAIRRRDIPTHSAWMMRGYAIALGAGTQALTLLLWILLFGPTDELSRTVLMTASWVINVAVAEYVIRRSTRRSGRTSAGLGQPASPSAACSAATNSMRSPGPTAPPSRSAPRHREEVVRPQQTTRKRRLPAPLHLQSIRHRGTCRKSRVMLHNRQPKPEPTEMGVAYGRTCRGGSRRRPDRADVGGRAGVGGRGRCHY